MIGLYLPGTSWLHRCRAGHKLAVLAAAMTALVALRSVLAVVIGLAVVALVAATARIPPRALLTQLRQIRWLLALVAGFQLLVADPETAVTITGTLTVAVLSAALVTLSTRVSAMLAAFTRLLQPLRRLGLDPDRVALLMALTLRSIPVLAEVFAQARDARRARGAERSPRALVVPLVVRTLRQADQLGEALAARGVDDP